jgi:hypothetical protein
MILRLNSADQLFRIQDLLSAVYRCIRFGKCTDYNQCHGLPRHVTVTIIHTHGDSLSSSASADQLFQIQDLCRLGYMVYRCRRLGMCTDNNQCNGIPWHLTHDHTYSWGLIILLRLSRPAISHSRPLPFTAVEYLASALITINATDYPAIWPLSLIWLSHGHTYSWSSASVDQLFKFKTSYLPFTAV